MRDQETDVDRKLEVIKGVHKVLAERNGDQGDDQLESSTRFCAQVL